MDLFFLTVPPQHAAENTTVKLDTKSLSEWLATLPVEDVTLTVASLRSALEAFNAITLETDERLKLLEVYCEALEEILFSYDEMKISMLQISAEQRRTLRQDIMWLYLELANGYKIIVLHGYTNNIQPAKNAALHISLYRTIELIVQALLYAFRAHETAPPLTYLEINQIYMFAEFYKVADKRIRSNKFNQGMTIERLYKQILLLILSDPYRLDSNELLDIFLFLEEYSDLCEIYEGVQNSAEQGKYNIDLMEDAPPVSTALLKQPQAEGVRRIIDVWPVIQELGIRIADNSTTHGTNFLQQRLVDMLIEQLLGQQQRTEQRNNVAEDIYLAIGLPAVCYYLSNKEHLVLSELSGSGLKKDSFDLDDETDSEIELSQWTICNKSQSGAMLQLNCKSINRELLVGDVVSLLVADGEVMAATTIAVIRWLKTENNVISVGVEYLPGKAAPVVFKIQNEILQYPGLYFHADTEQGVKPGLLAEQGLLLQSKKLVAEANGMTFAVEYIATLVETPMYCQFVYKAIRKA